MNRSGRFDYNTAIALREMDGFTPWNAMGEREAMGITVTGEDIWRGNELDPLPTSHTTIPLPAEAGEQMTVVSESDADNGATATGILTLRIDYLDATGEMQSEDITLDGTTPVNTVATDIRFVNDMYSLSPVGSNGVAEGHIKIYKTGSAGLVYNMIALGGNKSLVPHRMVPLDHKLLLKGWHATEAQNKRCTVRIRSTHMNGDLLPGVFCFQDVTYLKQSASGWLVLEEMVPALSLVKGTGWVVVPGAETSCSWRGWLIHD